MQSLKNKGITPVFQIVPGKKLVYPLDLDGSFEQTINHGLGTRHILVYAWIREGAGPYTYFGISPHWAPDPDDLNIVKVSFDEAYTYGSINIIGGGSGAERWSPVIIDNTDSPYSLASVGYDLIICDTTAGDVTVKLPTADLVTGTSRKIKNIGTNDVIVTTETADKIDTINDQITIATQYDCREFAAAAALKWFMISELRI